MRAYRILSTPKHQPDAIPGKIVYDCGVHDYGCASDDSRVFGTPHISVTFDKTGGYPFFTIPVRDLEKIEVEDFGVINDEWVKNVCKPGTFETCRYLMADSDGWMCAKLSPELRSYLNDRVAKGSMRAVGDNCEGRKRRI